MADNKNAKDRMTQELLKIKTQLAHMKNAGGTVKPASNEVGQPQGTPSTDPGVELKERLVELGLTNNELLQEINAYKKNEDNLLKQIRVLETLMERRIGELQEAYNELESKSAGLQKAADELQASHDDISRINNELHLTNTDLEQANQRLLQANQELHAEIDKLQQDIAESRQLEEKLRRQSSETEELLERRTSELAKTNNTLEQEISARERALNELKAHVESLEQQLQDLQRQTSYQETQMKERLENLKRESAEVEIASAKETPQAKMEISPDGMIRAWNAAAKKLFGYSAKEVQGFPFSILVPRNTFEAVQKMIGEVKAKLAGLSVDTVFVTKEGEQISVTVSASPILDNHGGLIGISTVVVEDFKQA